MKLSVTDIAFEGFRVVRDRPLAVLAWVVVQFLGALLVHPGGVMARNAYDQMVKLGFPAMGSPPPTTPLSPAQLAAMAPAMGDMMEGSLIALAIALIVTAITDPAIYRVALRPGERGFYSLQLGGQELRQLWLWVILHLLFFGALLTCGMGSFLFAGVFSVGGPTAAMLGLAVGVTATLCAIVYFAVRLSLAGPLTFEQNRVDVFGSWNMTRGRFYGLLGGYGLAVVMAGLVYVLSVVIFAAVASVLAGGEDKADALFSPHITHVADAYTPALIFTDVVSAVVSALMAAILVGARAEAYRQIKKGGVTA